MKAWTGICPRCKGSCVLPLTDQERKYSWNQGRNTKPCDNCGGQTMIGFALGVVPLRPDGTACVHEYRSVERWRCYRVYTCIHCKYSFDIDSGD